MMINRRNIQEIQKSPIMCFTPKLHTTATLIALHEYKLSLYHLQPFYLFVYELLVVATISIIPGIFLLFYTCDMLMNFGIDATIAKYSQLYMYGLVPMAILLC